MEDQKDIFSRIGDRSLSKATRHKVVYLSIIAILLWIFTMIQVVILLQSYNPVYKSLMAKEVESNRILVAYYQSLKQ